jgi:hypothetical protein
MRDTTTEVEVSMPLKTMALCQQENVPCWTLMGWLRGGKLSPPGKDSSGDFIWDEAAVQRVRALKQARLQRRVFKAE